MKMKKRRILSLLLAFVMIFKSIPMPYINVYADTLGEAVCNCGYEEYRQSGVGELSPSDGYMSGHTPECAINNVEPDELVCECGAEGGTHKTDCSLYAGPKCNCNTEDGTHFATCEFYTCPDCGEAGWHEVCPESKDENTGNTKPNPDGESDTEKEPESSLDFSCDVGKYAEFNEVAGIYLVCEGRKFTDSNAQLVMYYEDFEEDTIVKITDWYWDEDITGLWYQVEFVSGGVIAEAEEYWPEEPWVLQGYTEEEDSDKSLEFVTLEDDFELCDICGKANCRALHFYCTRCSEYDCGESHLYCLVCEDYDCKLEHVYCNHCGDYDCGLEHEDEDFYKPATAPVIPEEPTLTEDEDVSIVDEYGNPVTEDGLYLIEGMKSSISAWSALEEAQEIEPTYQWQIRIDSTEETWVDIQGQTEKGLLVSPAMFLSVIEETGSAAIRCRITSGDEEKISAAIPVIVMEQPMMAFYNLRAGSIPFAEDEGGEGENLQKSYVVVQYVYADDRTAASSDFAEVIPGTAIDYDYTLPVIPGYKAVLENAGTNASIEDGVLNVIYAKDELVAGEYEEIKVVYQPDYVKYTIIHYWQNVNDDRYTEHEREVIDYYDSDLTDNDRAHKTGDKIENAHKSYPGFYNLLYETPVAAADSSTVIEVYYDRYYYLMKFDLGDMGYGINPIYARAGVEIEIGTPIRAGYTFEGWQLNGVDATVPSEMPAENRTYTAKWQSVEKATVNVVIWGENPDDEGYSYIMTEQIEAKPGDTISWDVLQYDCGYSAHTHSVENGCYKLICSENPHAHTRCNLVCDLSIHTHSTFCCTKITEIHTNGKACYGNVVGDKFSVSIKEHWVEGTENNGSIGESYYTYIIGSNGTGNKYIYIDGEWYKYTGSVAIGGTATTVCNGIHSHADHTCTYCSLPVHAAHTDTCYDCGIPANDHQHTMEGCYILVCTKTPHTHNSGCEVDTDIMDTDLWKFVKSDTVVVEPDGTTKINVYYDRKEFTLKFNVNSTTVKTIIDKWGADIHNLFPIQGDNGTDYKGAEWKVPNGCENFTAGTNILSIDIMPPESITFTRNSQNDDAKLYYYIEVVSEDECTREYNGRHYKLYKTVYLPNSGRLTESEEFHDIAGFTKGDYYPSGIFSSVKSEMWLYYTRNSYAIEFYNPSDLIKKMQGIPYQNNLANYDWTPTAADAPTVYEPGSVAFAGWYLNPDCTGTEYILSEHAMPSATQNGGTAIALYAKWEPVEYKVNYYMSQKSLEQKENIPAEMDRLIDEAIVAGTISEKPSIDPYTDVFAEDIVKHGNYIDNPGTPGVTEGYEAIHPYTGYDFIGWFYLNEKGEETAFDPENMPVKQDLNLYGKWSSNTLCYYNVYFALDVKNNETGEDGSDGIADKDAKGNVIYIADPISGSAIAGRTYTFTAKGGEELYNLGEGQNYREGYFPTAGSHSITIDIADTDGTGANSYTFLYQQKSKVPYTVKYLEKGTNKVLEPEKYVEDNKKVVVTENFVYIKGYMPEEYQITLIVTDDGNASNDVIIFYYTKDEEHALYVVNYYIQDLDKNLNHKGWSKYDNLQSTGTIGKLYDADAITIDGFTLSADYTNGYNRAETPINGMTGEALPTTPINALVDGQISGTLSEKGMELNFYYTRNLYPYEFRYMLNGTTTELAVPDFGKAGYDTYVTGVAKEIEMDLDGDGINEDYRLYNPKEVTKDIHVIQDGNPLSSEDKVSKGQATVNVATFYYVRCTQTMTITKRVVDEGESSDPDPNQEFDLSLLIHAKNGYHRTEYTYKITEGENEVDSGTLSPVPAALNTLQFNLKAGQKITIEDLPTAEYTVSERNLPTGYYDTAGTGVRNRLTVDGQLDVTVTNTYDPAVLSITKNVDVVEGNGNTPEIDAFEFTIAVPAGTTGSYDYIIGTETLTETVSNGSMTIKLENGQTATFQNLPVGEYKVTETDYSAYGYDSNYKVNTSASYTAGQTATINAKRNATQTVEFMNKFLVGDLIIEKTVTKEFARTPWNGDTFKFTVKRTKKDLIAGNKYKVLVNGLSSSSFAVVGDDKLIHVELTFDAQTAATLAQTKADIVRTLQIENLPAGTYQVTEAVDSDYVQTSSAGNSLTVGNLKIPADKVVAEFTNEIPRPNGNLILRKELKNEEGYNGELPEGVMFEFTIELTEDAPKGSRNFTVKFAPETYTTIDTECVESTSTTPTSVTMENGKFTIQIQADQSVEIKDLPIGIYKITEASVPQYANKFAVWDGSDYKDQKSEKENGNLFTTVDITKESTVDVKCTNIYPVDTAELIIQKKVTKASNKVTLPENQVFTFTVTLVDEADGNTENYSYKIYNSNGVAVSSGVQTIQAQNGEFSIDLTDGQYVVIEDVPVCDYTIVESSGSSTTSMADYTVSYQVYTSERGPNASTSVNSNAALHTSHAGDNMSSTLVAGKTDAVIFTNLYHYGTLTITNDITGELPAGENQTFIFHISGNGVEMDVTISREGSVTVYDLPLGEYTVAEISEWSWRYNSGSTSQTTEISTSIPDPSVIFTHSYRENKWLNFFTYKLNQFKVFSAN